MKAIMMSIRPRHDENILNGIKTLEIRRKFPVDYVGWVYIYVTKDNDNLLHKNCANIWWIEDKYFQKKNKRLGIEQQPIYNGKVVARFWCDKVEGAYKFYVEELCQLACISKEELYKYAGGWYNTDDLLTIHITKLEIFDKPKEISEFLIPKETKYTIEWNELTKAPQSWCYIEI